MNMYYVKGENYGARGTLWRHIDGLNHVRIGVTHRPPPHWTGQDIWNSLSVARRPGVEVEKGEALPLRDFIQDATVTVSSSGGGVEYFSFTVENGRANVGSYTCPPQEAGRGHYSPPNYNYATQDVPPSVGHIPGLKGPLWNHKGQPYYVDMCGNTVPYAEALQMQRQSMLGWWPPFQPGTRPERPPFEPTVPCPTQPTGNGYFVPPTPDDLEKVKMKQEILEEVKQLLKLNNLKTELPEEGVTAKATPYPWHYYRVTNIDASAEEKRVTIELDEITADDYNRKTRGVIVGDGRHYQGSGRAQFAADVGQLIEDQFPTSLASVADMEVKLEVTYPGERRGTVVIAEVPKAIFTPKGVTPPWEVARESIEAGQVKEAPLYPTNLYVVDQCQFNKEDKQVVVTLRGVRETAVRLPGVDYVRVEAARRGIESVADAVMHWVSDSRNDELFTLVDKGLDTDVEVVVHYQWFDENDWTKSYGTMLLHPNVDLDDQAEEDAATAAEQAADGECIERYGKAVECKFSPTNRTFSLVVRECPESEIEGATNPFKIEHEMIDLEVEVSDCLEHMRGKYMPKKPTSVDGNLTILWMDGRVSSQQMRVIVGGV